jgi:polysaccharide export outer membrane protein
MKRLHGGRVALHEDGRESTAALRSALRRFFERRRLELGILAGIVALCLAYCLLTPRQYESRAVLALRTAPAGALRTEGAEQAYSGSFASGQVQLETLAGELRSDGLAWRVILEKKLYAAPPFNGRFAVRYWDFRPEAPAPEAEAYLLERFAARLRVRTIPRTLLLEVRFRSGDPVLSRDVIEALMQAYTAQNAAGRIAATQTASGWLKQQLAELKARADAADERAAVFQREHGLLETPSTQTDGQPAATQHNAAVLQADELNRELVTASAERILREAEFRAAEQGDPEAVLASDARLQSESGALSSSAFRQIHARRSELAVERAQLSAEHGPNFPRVVEIAKELDELDRQLEAQKSQLRERFRTAWQTAEDRERMLRAALGARTGEGLAANAAAARLAAMRREAEETRAVYLRLRGKADEAGATAGVDSPVFDVVDAPRRASKPAWPNWPLSFAIALFVGVWAAACAGYVVRRMRWAAAFGLLAAATCVHAQAPTPSTSGLPTGVERIPQTRDNRVTPNPAEAGGASSGPSAVLHHPVREATGPSAAIPGPIGPGDILEISEAHMPEFRTVARVSPAGSVALPLIGEVKLAGIDESAAAKAIADALVQQGMLLHPQVFVMVTASGAQDVTVMGEVLRPGVYPYGAHHRLLDVISQASGLTPAAGSLVYISHRQEVAPEVTVQPAASGQPALARRPALTVALDPSGEGRAEDHNPELQPGDTVQVTRVGLVYVVGDVIRPGGFPLEPSRRTTVLQALSLAWGPSQNAALSKALLIREQNDGRTVTVLNLKRMLHGQDPDLPLSERDILYVPDSTAKNLWNRTAESVVQSAVGVSIYAAEVYSLRF